MAYRMNVHHRPVAELCENSTGKIRRNLRDIHVEEGTWGKAIKLMSMRVRLGWQGCDYLTESTSPSAA